MSWVDVRTLSFSVLPGFASRITNNATELEIAQVAMMKKTAIYSRVNSNISITLFILYKIYDEYTHFDLLFYPFICLLQMCVGIFCKCHKLIKYSNKINEFMKPGVTVDDCCRCSIIYSNSSYAVLY